MTIQTQNNSLNYLIDPTFTKGNRLFVLSFGNETGWNIVFKILFTKSWNKRFECINWWKKFLELPVKNKGKAYEKIIEMSRNNDYTTGNLLDYE